VYLLSLARLGQNNRLRTIRERPCKRNVARIIDAVRWTADVDQGFAADDIPGLSRQTRMTEVLLVEAADGYRVSFAPGQYEEQCKQPGGQRTGRISRQ
jgi:hypothetical protein